MNTIYNIAVFTARDQMKRKSFYLLLAVAIMFILTIRGCYRADYTVNSQQVDRSTIALYASMIIFHTVSIGMIMMAVLLSMKNFTRDLEDGSITLFLSRPVSRVQYILGRVIGTWGLCSCFMLVLHLTIFLITLIQTRTIIPGYLTASLVSSCNLLIAVSLVCLLTLLLPDFIAALGTLAVITVGFVSDGGQRLFSNEAIKEMVTRASGADLSVATWRLYYPKVGMLQYYAGSLIKGDEYQTIGPIHPMINVLIYCLLILSLSIAIFKRKELY